MYGSKIKIAGTILAGGVFIAGALFFRSYITPNVPVASVSVVTQAPERISIKTFDENNDGVPDWQESLLITEALQIASTTSSYKEPETLTEQFALDFFQNIVRSENYGAFGDTPDELVLEASEALAKQAVDELLGTRDIIISNDDSLQAQSLYGELVAAIIANYSIDDGLSETKILEKALRTQNENDLQELDYIIEVYTKYLDDTMSIPVPPSVQKEHLDLLNSYKAILIDIQAMRKAFSDPMYTLLRMKRYQNDSAGLYISIVNLYNKLIKNGIVWQNDSVVYTLINIDGENQ